MKLFIQIPCFNEQENIAETINSIPSKIEGIDEVKILIIDDGSTDQTREVAKKNGAHHILRLRRNMGLARAFQAGLKESISLGADIVVNTDGDNQYNACDIPKLIFPIIDGSADFVIGCRPIKNHPEFSFIKKKLQLLGSWCLRKISKTDIPDAASGFRAYSKETCLRLNIYSTFSHCMETLIQAGNSGLKVGWVNIRINPKTRNSRLFKSLIHYLLKSGQTIIYMSSLYAPGRFFSYLAILSFIPALLLGGRFVYLEYTGLREAGTHLPSLVLLSLFGVTSLAMVSLAVFGELLKAHRKLNEEILFQMRKESMQNSMRD